MDSTLLKRCLYCQRLHPSGDFMKVVRGRGGRVVVNQCGSCYRARQNREANKERLETIIANNKEANKRTFTAFAKERSR